ncbi:YesL family protein [Niallia sp. NCCP-28]|uniref:YesL family protein n=1 Tax=Niallia sp. NCCP-28 TaxID=2934712 RepID=UPI0020C112C5|nr:DUF624 domain-containing protein [Niallia sp. NCCP-28]
MMTENRLIDWLYCFSFSVLKCLFLNIKWLFFTLLGLIVLGIFPATVALFTIVHKWLQGEINIPSFYSIYKKEFVKSNLFGLLFAFIGAILYCDLLMLQQTSIVFLQFLYIPALVISFIYICGIFSFFIIYVHYHLEGIKLLKYSFLFPIIYPFFTVKMMFGILIISYLCITFPSLPFLFGGSIASIYMMWIFSKQKLMDRG